MVKGSHHLLFIAILALLGLPAVAQTAAAVGSAANASNGADVDIIQPGGLYGSSSVSGSTITVKGSGPDLIRNKTGFHAYWWSIVGDSSITARIVSLTNTNQYAKAGLIFDESSYYNFGYVIPTGKVAGYNAIFNGMSAYFSYSFPMWIKAVQVGGGFEVDASQDGVNWQEILGMGGLAPQHVGLAVTSHDVTQLATAVFDNVSFTGSVTATPDYTQTTTPLTQTVAPGYFATFHTTFRPRNAFFGDVAVDTNPFDAFVPFAIIQTGPTSTLVPGTATVDIQPFLGTPPGTYPVNITSSSVQPSPAVTHGNNTSITVTGNLLPAPPGAGDADIGNPPIPGSSSFSNGVLSLHGSGNLSVTPDQFHYYYWLMSGNGSVTARLTSLSGTTSNQKAGIMMRQSLTNDDDYVMASAPVLHGGQVGTQLQYRDETNPGRGVFIAPYTYHNLPVWIRLTRINSVYEVRWSTDGQTWYLYDGSIMPYPQTDNHTSLPYTTYVGFATNTDAVFDNIQVTGSFADGPPFMISPMRDFAVRGGATANFTVSFLPVAGFNGPVTFTATASPVSGAPTTLTPVVSPASLTGSGTITVTIPTTRLQSGYTFLVTLTATYPSGVFTESAYLTVN